MILRIFLLLFVIHCATSENFRFDNYTLYKTFPKSIAEVKHLQNLQDSDTRFDFWSEPVPNAESVSILASPAEKNYFEEYLRNNEIEYRITFSNIQEIIDKQIVKPYTRGNLKSFAYDAYHTNDEINAWIDDLARTYPNIVTAIVGGTTYEGRDIKGLKISHGSGKKVIFIEGGIHSREWISPASVIYMANELLTSNDEETQAAAKEFDWFIFPVTNPDGYVWSHEEYRLWRKNRRPVGSEYGIDLNRNWNQNWLMTGASTDPSSNTYAGVGPFSEPESRTLSEFIRSIGDKIELYLSIHSAGQLLLLPYGNTTDPLANYYDAMNIGRRAMGALSVRYGTQYVTGNIAEAIYEATGSSVDWVKDHLNVPLTYVYELRDKGEYHFLLPPEQIVPTGEETLDSVLEMIHQAKRFGYMNSGAGVKVSAVMVVLAMIVCLLQNLMQ